MWGSSSIWTKGPSTTSTRSCAIIQSGQSERLYMYVLYVYVYVCMHILKYLSVYVYVYMYVCMYVCIYVCIF